MRKSNQNAMKYTLILTVYVSLFTLSCAPDETNELQERIIELQSQQIAAQRVKQEMDSQLVACWSQIESLEARIEGIKDSLEHLESQSQSKQAAKKSVAAPRPIENDDDNVYNFVKEMPRFPGCENLTSTEREKCSDEKLIAHIKKEINYPPIARENGIEGTVVVKFVVGKTGEISNAQIMRDIGGGCGQEALRIVNAMPGWIPGENGNGPVNVSFTLPVKFRLE